MLSVLVLIHCSIVRNTDGRVFNAQAVGVRVDLADGEVDGEQRAVAADWCALQLVVHDLRLLSTVQYKRIFI